ncbi:poly(3-hydroxyalkanoate) depolymerase [Salinisphaera dokdonensis CL-ES53]|uniref:Poly(3-hydroxyalkanoate) depolymerase n=2 Tax=Salinisphaera TaxID=180541 RepID=A0ABV2AXW7_9GAMM
MAAVEPLQPEAESQAHLREMVVRGARVRVSMQGEGEPLLLIMGIGASLDMWAPFERAMVARGYQVIAFDLPGAGASKPLFPPRRMRGLARIAVGVLDALEIGQASVLGVSFGGAVAQEVGHVAPERVRRLILAATAPGLGGLPGDPRALMHMLTPLRYWSPNYARRIAGTLYGGRAREAPDDQANVALRFMRPPSLYGYLTQMYAISGWTSLLWLHRLKPQTLVLAGNDDPIIPLFNGKMIAAVAPNATLEVIDGGGHLFLLDQTDEVADIVDTFLAD